MSETPETPQTGSDPTAEPSPTTETPVAEAPAPPVANVAAPAAAASSRRGIWKYLGAGAIGLVVGAVVAGLIAWGVGGDDKDHRDSRPAMSQQRGGGQMPSGPGGRSGGRGDGQMQNGPMPGGQNQQGQPNQQGQAQNGQQAQSWGSQGGMGAGGRTRAS